MAIKPGTSFGLCTKRRTYSELNSEKKQLYDAAQRYYETVILIDPKDVLYFFQRGATNPRLMYHGRDIAGMTTLLIRSTGGREASSALLAHTLAFCGCNSVDPVERFSVGYASKLMTTIGRFERGVGSNSYIAFGAENAVQLLQHLDISEENAILFKPVAGRKGEGVVTFTQLTTAIDFVQHGNHGLPKAEMPFLFQTLERFVAEFRVMVIDGEILGMVQKLRAEGSIAANAAQGGVFIAADEPNVSLFVQTHVSQKGLLGVDVAIDDKGRLHIIETNRAPMWEAFEAATGVKVAEELMKKLTGQ